ncbi:MULTISPECIES: polysaccharide biosynthesis/export family protein [Winogradskyella]|uniref:polysaccharide biosynthesis/export family protein n=1 Tax=Winogradskyella TaxID=286104 RepID=UPI0015C94130|nr:MULTISPECIES: polysaccharide biosynthesis/export family protein [Winogradskyella]QNK78774.1 polysaccharide biosynthesis/export family protein [Winogradskyella sp. PAMC22761]QXP78193.1 polysaccharide biosynthesis/export family protein [Winogradskyella sp. HaHa_3_26]
MKPIKLLIILLCCIVVSSCIPHKDTVYLQIKEDASNDSIVNNLTEIQKPYRIQVNDILNIRVKALDQETVSILNPAGDGDLNASSAERAYFDGFTVDVHGNVRIPTLGYLNVLGFTTEEIENLIEAKLLDEQFKETANIFVTVKLAGLRYTANGEVGSPGSNVLFSERVNIFEAIANVGEIPVTGNKKDVLIIRQYPQGQKIHHLDLTDIKVMQSPYYYIQPNDIIYVKPLKQKSIGTGETALSSITAIASILSLITTAVLLYSRL